MRTFFSHRLIWLALLLSLGIGVLFARTIWQMRQDEWVYAQNTNANLVYTLQHSVRQTIESMDSSLQGTVTELQKPGVLSLPPSIRNRVLFDNSLRARGVGSVLVLNAQGVSIMDSAALEPRRINFADRDYFLAFQREGHQGLFIGQPVSSRITGQLILPLSRPYYTSDGRFAGVVVGALRLEHFNELFASVNLGPKSGVNLFRSDGVIIARFPYGDADVGKSIAGTPNMLRFQAAAQGSFVGVAVLDGVRRQYAFHHVEGLPLIINVAQATDNILVKWTRSAWSLGAFALLLMVSCVALAGLFTRELLRRQAVSARLREAEHDVRTILNNMPSMIGYWDAQLINRFANQAYIEWFGVSPERLRGMHISELMGPALFALNRPYIDRALAGEPQLFERTLVNQRGEERHTMASYLPDFEDGKVCGIFVQVTDISDRKRMEHELFEEKERIRLTLQSIGDAVVCADAQGRVTFLNPVAERLTGWKVQEAVGQPADELVAVRDRDGQPLAHSPLHTAIAQGRAVDTVRGVIINRHTGQHFDVEEMATPITDRHGQVTGGVTVLRDVSEAMAMAERMAHLAQYDPLTDLPNRLLLQDRAQLAMAQARRDGNCLALMYLDLDGFKQINDSLGHDAGDQLLVQFARRLQAAVRQSDTVCRQGGDEFVVLLPGLEGAAQAAGVARKILALCDSPYELHGRLYTIGVSGGIALFPLHGESFDELSRYADSAMYAAKNAGRAQFRVYRQDESEPQLVVHASDAHNAAEEALAPVPPSSPVGGDGAGGTPP